MIYLRTRIRGTGSKNISILHSLGVTTLASEYNDATNDTGRDGKAINNEWDRVKKQNLDSYVVHSVRVTLITRSFNFIKSV
jgi:hypothetical protein